MRAFSPSAHYTHCSYGIFIGAPGGINPILAAPIDFEPNSTLIELNFQVLLDMGLKLKIVPDS
jgi:hypothetical protein